MIRRALYAVVAVLAGVLVNVLARLAPDDDDDDSR